ncbi:MAG: CarD family transcriptional regulator [Pseudomonadota bacterium]|nr:CarD family transcriptional regulator [Pseudomonadota bacterium]
MVKKNTPTYKIDDFIVYPTHGTGKIVKIENEVFDGKKIDFYVINFEQDRLLLRVPKEKAEELGLRRTSSKDRIKEAINALKTPRRASTLMWSRRAEEYQLKINSGDPVQLAEVLRDLYKGEKEQEQSYSERQIYKSAMERLAREYAAIEKTDEDSATKKLEKVLGH